MSPRQCLSACSRRRLSDNNTERLVGLTTLSRMEQQRVRRVFLRALTRWFRFRNSANFGSWGLKNRRNCRWGMIALDWHLLDICHDQVSTMRQPVGMALFGMVWLLRVRSEMKRCTKCKRQQHHQRNNFGLDDGASTATFFTIDAPTAVTTLNTPSPGHSLAPTTYCEVHGYNLPKEGEVWFFRKRNAFFIHENITRNIQLFQS